MELGAANQVGSRPWLSAGTSKENSTATFFVNGSLSPHLFYLVLETIVYIWARKFY